MCMDYLLGEGHVPCMTYHDRCRPSLAYFGSYFADEAFDGVNVNETRITKALRGFFHLIDSGTEGNDWRAP